MEEKVNKRVQRSREMLKGALTELLKTQPFDRISVKGICEKAGINRSTFYVHYSCPRDLIDELENDILSHLPCVSSNDKEDIIASLSIMMEYIKNNSSVVEVLMSKGVSSAFSEKLMTTVMDRYKTFLKIEDDELSRRCYLFCISGVIGLVWDWIANGTKASCYDISSTIIELAFRVMGQENIILHSSIS